MPKYTQAYLNKDFTQENQVHNSISRDLSEKKALATHGKQFVLLKANQV